MKLFERLFASLCYSSKKALRGTGEEMDPWPLGMTLSLSTSFILISLSDLIVYEFNMPRSFHIGSSYWTFILLGVLFGIIYYKFLRNDQHKKIIAEFEKLSIRRKKIWLAICLTYHVFSIGITMASFTWH